MVSCGFEEVQVMDAGSPADDHHARIVAPSTPLSDKQIESAWKRGETLPAIVTEQYPFPPLKMGREDTGINVLIDLAHACNFYMLWSYPGFLAARGIRGVGSQACLDTVLVPGSKCRVRAFIENWRMHPFAWWPAPRFNVVVTSAGASDQDYLESEREALRAFVENGGGLVVYGSRVRDAEQAKEWTLNLLLATFGASILHQTDAHEGRTASVLRLDDSWEVVARGAAGKPLHARRSYGRGRVVLLSDRSLLAVDKKGSNKEAEIDRLAEAIVWAASGSPPVGGEPRMPTHMCGGGPIYPELEKRSPGVVAYYAGNQFPQLVATIEEDLPDITGQIYAWLPSPKPEEPMFMILSSGGGGGWAVNAYLPKETGTISKSVDGVRSVFAHEQAHTMSGPCSAANHAMGGNRGEPHAGWFQGKIDALYRRLSAPNRGCGGVFLKNADIASGDPSKIFRKKDLEKWRGDGWTYGMVWYVWQKLDDRYGTTWYPRWRWVQGKRWTDDPGRKLTWDETIEDISIAVGEDLFPFFAKTGKKLEKMRFERVEFRNRLIELPVAPIEPTTPGNVRLDAIGNYKVPLKPVPAR
jgi:hypothetical protein